MRLGVQHFQHSVSTLSFTLNFTLVPWFVGSAVVVLKPVDQGGDRPVSEFLGRNKPSERIKLDSAMTWLPANRVLGAIHFRFFQHPTTKKPLKFFN